MKLPILNLVKLQQQLDQAKVYEDEDGNRLQTIYLGSILQLTPSGKVYYPFACSNVEPCPKCKGHGNVLNKHYKKKKYEQLDRKHLQLLHQDSPPWIKISKVYKQKEHWSQLVSCDLCAGMGSLEARLDQDWWTQLEEKLEYIDAGVHGSEGDGCDVMISRCACERGD